MRPKQSPASATLATLTAFVARAAVAALILSACSVKTGDVTPDKSSPPSAATDGSAQGNTNVTSSAASDDKGGPHPAASKPKDVEDYADMPAPARPKTLMERLYPNAPAGKEKKNEAPAVAEDGLAAGSGRAKSAPEAQGQVYATPQAAAAQSRGQHDPKEQESLELAAPADAIAPSPSAASLKGYAAEAPAPLCKKPAREYDQDYRDREEERARCMPYPPRYSPNTAEYAPIYENTFLEARSNPLSTFSIDVDGASYSNTRRFLQEGQLPPADAVRIEEFINYFDYDYPNPSGSDPFSITTEVATTPWNPETKLVHIGLQGRRVQASRVPPNNLVFLIDVSGSMDSPERLPLIKNAFSMLIDQLRPQDRVSIVVYAGAAGMVLPPTPGSEKETIREAVQRLQAGGSTAGGAGLMLAYRAASQSFIRGGNNRVILATDGDFNVGLSSDDELTRLIEEKRKSGVFLSALGVGTDNYKDAKMEAMADKGNGNYYYIDNIEEARKVLVEKMTGTLYTIAKDVKLQVEFNPAAVKSYRLIGYENRALAAEDFNDDRKDAGELGAGSNVTALYEIVPAVPARPKVDPLKYQGEGSHWHWSWGSNASSELLTVKFRYKQPDGSVSRLLSRVLRNNDVAWQDASENFRFSAAAAGFGLMLRNSQYRGDLDLAKVAAMARGARGRDLQGHRAEFIGLVETARDLMDGRVGYHPVRGE